MNENPETPQTPDADDVPMPSEDAPEDATFAPVEDKKAAEPVTDAVTGEELHAFSVTLADGRNVTVNARDEDTARALAREQGGNVGVLSVEEG